MNYREHYTRLMESELGELDYEDKEVLESVINFNRISDKMERLF